MPRTPLDDVLRYLRRSYAAHAPRDLTDGELLERFVNQREEAAVTILVQRHGPMVLSVCERVLGNSDGAEDAFQATFLVLVRQASSIGRREPLGGWLYGVAQRIAMKARAQAGARRQRERRFAPMACTDSLDDLTWRELRSVLDEEIGRLPEKYRTPIVLCYLEGKSNDQAAKELGLAKSSLGNRVVRGRELLRQQLVRRGITLSAGAVATALCEKVAGASLPALLTIKTVNAAALVAGGKAVAGGCISAPALALAEEAMTGMSLIKGKLVVMVLALGLAIGGAGWAGYRGLAERSQLGPAANAQAPAPIKQIEVPAKKDQPIAMDQYGESLPEGALARLGSIRGRHGFRITNSALSPDAKYLATASNNSVVIWDLAAGKRLHTFPGDDRYSFDSPGLEFSPDGRRLVYTQHPGFAAVWDLQSGKEVRCFQDPIRYPLTGPSHFTSDGESVILTQQERTEIINLSTGKVIRSLPVGNIRQISADGGLFVRQERDKRGKLAVLFGELLTGKTKVRVEVVSDAGPLDSGTVYAVLAPDSRTFAIVQKSLGLIELRDSSQGKVQTTFKVSDPWISFVRLGFSANGKTLWLVAGSGVLYRWDLESGKELAPLEKQRGLATGYHELADNKTAVTTSADGLIRRWDNQTGRELSKEEGYFRSTSAGFSPDGSLIAVADSGGRLDLWDAARGSRIKALREKGSGVVRLAFTPDGKSLGAVEESGQVQRWEIATGKLAQVPAGKAQGGGLHAPSILFSRDGCFLFFFGDPWGEARLTETLSGKQVWISKGICAAALSPDGSSLIAAVGGPWVAYLDLETGKERKKLRISVSGHPVETITGQAIYSLAVAPDGRHLAFGLFNGQIALLDFRNGPALERLLLKPRADNNLIEEIGRDIGGSVGGVSSSWPPVYGLAFTLDGNWLVSGRGGDGVVRVHEVLTGNEVANFKGHESGILSVAISPDGRKVLSCGHDGQAYLWDLRPAQAALSRKPVSALWDDLASKDARQAYLAMWSLVDVPGESLPFLRRTVKPVPVAEKIQTWIADLDSENFAARQTATKELEKVGQQIQAPIQKALEGNPSVETRRRLEQILKALPDLPGPETLHTIRAIMALERIASPEARSILETLAHGAPGARETEEARASLERLAQRTSKMP